MRPKISYVYHLDASRASSQSGRPASILRGLEAAGAEVQRVFPLEQRFGVQRTAKKVFWRGLGWEYRPDREPALLRDFARQIRERLAIEKGDVIFCPGTLPISALETDIPVAFCADAPLSAMVDYYGSFTRLAPPQRRSSEEAEAAALRLASLAVYPSEWAANSAIANYGIDPARVAVIPFGANFGRMNLREDIANCIQSRSLEEIRLLFIGKEWKRKGGRLVVDTARCLIAMGRKVRVDVVGTTPPAADLAEFVTCHRLLRYSVPAELAQLEALARRAHFFFMPSRAEAYGMVYCEGNAFGLPIIAAATGGVTTIVRQGVNGFLLPLDADAAAYAQVIMQATDTEENYRALALRSYDEFRQRLNWETHCKTFLDLIDTRVLSARSADKGARANGDLNDSESVPPPETASSAPSQAPVDLQTSASTPELSRNPAPRTAPSLRVAFVANDYFDPLQVGAWSGLPYFMWKSFENQGVQVQIIRLSSRHNQWLRWLKFGAAKLLRGRRYLRDRDTSLLRSFARQIEKALAGQTVDFLFSPGTAPVAYVETKIPIAYWVDASFAGMADFYASFSRLSRTSIKEGHASDQSAIDRAALAIYSSDWAADSVRQAYRVDQARLHVVCFGANLSQAPDEVQIREIIRGREKETCRLLLVGVDWERKGAGIALAVLDELGVLGIKAHLTVIGCNAPPHLELPPNVEIVGFVSKESEEGRQLIERHFRESHFFLMPTRAEAYGLVFCEANAFGLPCVASAVGGIPSIIEDGTNGYLLPTHALPSEFAACIADIWRDRDLYETYALNCHRIYRERLNWDTAGREVVGLMRDYLTRKDSPTT